VWRWDQGEPFGNDVPNNNPSGGGAFDFPLRFPGQYFDRETGLAQNWFRDYDTAIGRYVQNDPVSVGKHARMWMAGLASISLTGEVVALASKSLSQTGAGFDSMGKLRTERPPLAINPYVYALSSPVRWTDPTGLLVPPGGGGGSDDSCPLVAEVFLGFVPPLFPLVPVGLTVWLCVHNCCKTCPAKETCMWTETQWSIPGIHDGCYPSIPRDTARFR